MSAGGAVAILFAATYPERVQSLVLYGASARYQWSEDYAIGMPTDEVELRVRFVEERWGTGVLFDRLCPSANGNPVLREQYARFQRASASPGSAGACLRALLQIDVRHALPLVSAPTLVVHAAGDRSVPIERARYVADRIPGATMVELASEDHLIWLTDKLDALVDSIHDFVTGATPPQEITRVLATVLFVAVSCPPATDAHAGDELARRTRGSQQMAAQDVGYLPVATLRRLRDRAGRLVERYRGKVVSVSGQGVRASFDGPARAVRCATALVGELTAMGLPARAGLHSGECDMDAGQMSGVAVDVAHALALLAQPGEVMVSRTVVDLVTGSTIAFDASQPNAVETAFGRWPVYVVAAT